MRAAFVEKNNSLTFIAMIILFTVFLKGSRRFSDHISKQEPNIVSTDSLHAQSPYSRLKTYQTKAKQIEARMRLEGISSNFQSEYSKTSKYTEKDMQEYLKGNPFSTSAKHGPLYKIFLNHKECNECGVSPTKFKVAAIGNIDEDETLDVWTIDQAKNLVNVINDVTN